MDLASSIITAVVIVLLITLCCRWCCRTKPSTIVGQTIITETVTVPHGGYQNTTPAGVTVMSSTTNYPTAYTPYPYPPQNTMPPPPPGFMNNPYPHHTRNNLPPTYDDAVASAPYAPQIYK